MNVMPGDHIAAALNVKPNTINLSDLKIAEKTLVDVMERYLPTAEIDL